MWWGTQQLAAASSGELPWLWRGFLYPGAVTLLTSQWKTGKTTLISVLLSRLSTGGQLAGFPVSRGQAVVVSEESLDLWAGRARRLPFGNDIGVICRPFPGRPSPAEWSQFVDGLVALSHERPLSLVAIDTLASFYPGNTENNAAVMLEALMPLQRLTARGLSVLISHHPSKDDPPIGRAARGSGALSGFVDILLELRCLPNAALDARRRRLYAFSRYPATPRQLLIEWTADGTDYRNLGTIERHEFNTQWPTIQAILHQAPDKLSRAQIRAQWPTPSLPGKTALYQWLTTAVDLGLAHRDGKGRRCQPFRYWLPERG
jgi:hypothetical protein